MGTGSAKLLPSEPEELPLHGPAIECLSDHPEHLAAARLLLEQYVRLPDAWERYGGVPVELPRVFDDELSAFPAAARPPTGDVVIAVATGKVAAAGHVVEVDRNTCEFKRVFVRPEHQHRGIGIAIADAMIGRAASLGYERVLIDVMPERRGAIAFWTRLGFTPCDPYREYPFAMVFMERELGPAA